MKQYSITELENLPYGTRVTDNYGATWEKCICKSYFLLSALADYNAMKTTTIAEYSPLVLVQEYGPIRQVTK